MLRIAARLGDGQTYSSVFILIGIFVAVSLRHDSYIEEVFHWFTLLVAANFAFTFSTMANVREFAKQLEIIEEELGKAQRQSEAMCHFAAIPTLVLEVTPSVKVAYASPAVLELTGNTSESELVEALDRQNVIKNIKQKVETRMEREGPEQLKLKAVFG